MANKSKRLDDNTTFLGILIGFLLGAIYTLLHIRHRGEVNRKNLTQFGAGSLEIDINSSLDSAKQEAQQRLKDD